MAEFNKFIIQNPGFQGRPANFKL